MSKLVLAQDGFEDSMVLVIGDVHGFTKTYQKLIKILPPGLRSIQVGDMGIGFKGAGLHQMGPEHSWFRGNHDNPEKCRATYNYRGDYGYDAATGIFHVAGAWSIDRASRVAGETWWADEELSYTELSNIIAWYEQVKPRFVLSHEAPTKAGATLLYYAMIAQKGNAGYWHEKLKCGQSRTAEALQQMLEIHQPKEWIFGHYHFDKEFHTPGFNTKFVCVGGMMESGEPPHTYVLDTKE